MLRDGYDTPLTSCVKFVCLGPNACDCLKRSVGGKAPHEGFGSQLFVAKNEDCCMLKIWLSLLLLPGLVNSPSACQHVCTKVLMLCLGLLNLALTSQLNSGKAGTLCCYQGPN